MFPSFYIYNENNFQTIIDITEKSASTNDETSKYKDFDVENDSSIDSELVSQDDSMSIEQDLEPIYSELLCSSIDRMVNDNDSISTDDNALYMSSEISTNEEFYVDNNDEEIDDISSIDSDFVPYIDEEIDDRESIEVLKRSTNYDSLVRKIYKKKKSNYEKIIHVSIAIFTIAFILNWFI